MLPVADSFNFVVCGFATLAASVGYAYARKTRPLPSRGVPQPPDLLGDNDSISNSAPGPSGSLEKQRDEYSEATPLLSSSTLLEKSTEEDQNGIAITADSVLEPTPAAGNETTVLSKHNSLKRKRTHERDETDPDMGYPHNLRSIYPNKRRSGSVSEEEPTKDVEDMVAEPSGSPSDREPHPMITSATEASESSNNQEPYPIVTSEPASSGPKPDSIEGSSSPEKFDEPVLAEEPKLDVVECPTPEPPKVLKEVPRFVFPKTPPRITQFPSPRTTTSPGFANFAGSSSPFFHTTSLAGKPIWASPLAGEEASGACADDQKPSSALAPAVAKTQTPAVQPHSTGEEDEDVALELKGVKLYIKRGEENFSGGMMGHIKLLSHKTSSAKRLLFRREPLWKVSMNVRMHATVRCTFDPQENILRVALKELPEKSASEEGAPIPQTVIYAFKASRLCRRSDFQEFAEALLAQARQSGLS